MELHDTLGVSPDADDATIKKAYKARAKKLHPDAGGDAAEFQRVTGAYLVLRDPARRAHYERTGETESGGVDTVRQEALSVLSQAIVQVLHSEEAAAQDWVKRIREGLQNQSRALAREIKVAAKRRAQVERNAKRFKRKGDGADIVAQIAASAIREIAIGEAKAQHQIAVFAAAVEYLDGYEYEWTQPDPRMKGAQMWANLNSVIGSSSTTGSW